MKTHWRRCRSIAKLLEVNPAEVNKHWACCLKSGCEGEFTEDADVATKIMVRRAYADCLLRLAKRDAGLVSDRAERAAATRHYESKRPPRPDAEQTVEDRVKMALWLIKQCGGMAQAQDALDRAKLALE